MIPPDVRPNTPPTPDATIVSWPSDDPPARRAPTARTDRRPSPLPHRKPAQHLDPTTKAESQSPKPAPSSDSTKTDGILARRDPVPGGVQAQLRYFLGGGGPPCMGGGKFDVTATDSGRRDHISAPDMNTICVYEARPGIRLDVTLTSPSGRLIRAWSVVPADERPITLSLRSLPHDEMGNHIVQAIQGSRSVAKSVEVRNVRHPQLIPYVDDRHGQPGSFPPTSPLGTTFRVAVGGFAPHSVVPLRIYGAKLVSEPGYASGYVTSHPVRVDALGFGIWELRTSAVDPADCYLVTHESISEDDVTGGVEFCLR
ncbi:hypothetical protein Ari01nite_24290 [Paractinoplanes rishiriensis]|uniref:Uncharacterized protein n=1 Tax=Paractinoplanes rishiriensis TaxID=1050105 RepID=A0A919JWM5_9ACTN|nr:hypothetical protein Ari01nite_24290 [Actinoplanes rishiriensis]